MSTVTEGFPGFPAACLTFLEQLAQHNDRAWFAGHKDEFEQHVLDPARRFVVALGGRLRPIAPGVHAEPQVDRSIFRLARDVRFSLDKSPYKTSLGIFCWEGDRPKMECPGFYLHFDPSTLMLGAGIYAFPAPMLQAYREAVVDPGRGGELAGIVAALRERGGYDLGGQHYKKPPRGYATDPSLAGLLLHNGLYAGLETDPELALGPQLLEQCTAHFTTLAPLHRWLVGLGR